MRHEKKVYILAYYSSIVHPSLFVGSYPWIYYDSRKFYENSPPGVVKGKR